MSLCGLERGGVDDVVQVLWYGLVSSSYGQHLAYTIPGESVAVWNLTTDSLRYVARSVLSLHIYIITSSRFLNNEQSAADSANFIANVKFPGVDEDITAPNTPWIYYGVRSSLGIVLPSHSPTCAHRALMLAHALRT